MTPKISKSQLEYLQRLASGATIKLYSDTVYRWSDGHDTIAKNAVSQLHKAGLIGRRRGFAAIIYSITTAGLDAIQDEAEKEADNAQNQ